MMSPRGPEPPRLNHVIQIINEPATKLGSERKARAEGSASQEQSWLSLAAPYGASEDSSPECRGVLCENEPGGTVHPAVAPQQPSEGVRGQEAS